MKPPARTQADTPSAGLKPATLRDRKERLDQILCSMEEAEPGTTLIEMKGITKRFPGVLANDDIDFSVKAGEIHALLGENGAGKTTLMNILSGLYSPDEGEIRICGQEAAIASPRDAIDLGIGMVHQHFMLIPIFTVTENIVLGLRSPKDPFLDLEEAERTVAELSERYNLMVDPRSRVRQLSVGEQQRVEILKMLYRGVSILILDEPTSVLTPQEVEDLFSVLKDMTSRMHAIIMITHKLEEVMRISDRATILRDGRVVATVETSKSSGRELARMMVGRDVVIEVPDRPAERGGVVLEVNDLQALNDRGLPALKGVSLTVNQGEILGVAGVSGNGQRELAEVVTGLRKATRGRVIINGADVTNRPPQEIIREGVAHIPEERMRRGVIEDFSVKENLLLGLHGTPPFAYGSRLPLPNKWFLDEREIDTYAEKLVEYYDIRTTSLDTLVKTLSGGNVQKVILARELSQGPRLLIAAQPTRGLDVSVTEHIYRKLLEEKEKGTAIMLISEDLSELMSLSDRIAVFYEGAIVGTAPRGEAHLEEIGEWMTGVRRTTRPREVEG